MRASCRARPLSLVATLALTRGVHGQWGEKSTSAGECSRRSYFRRWINGSVGWKGELFSRWFYRWWAPVSSDSSKCALPDHFSTLNRDKSPLTGSGLRMLFLLAVLIGSMQLNMARRAQGHPGSEPDVLPFGPFWSTWRTLRSSILGPKRPRRSFPSAVTHLESGSMTPSTVIRPRVVSVQVPEVADFAFCPIVGHATAVAYNKIW